MATTKYSIMATAIMLALVCVAQAQSEADSALESLGAVRPAEASTHDDDP